MHHELMLAFVYVHAPWVVAVDVVPLAAFSGWIEFGASCTGGIS